jgi:hypothetical protein
VSLVKHSTIGLKKDIPSIKGDIVIILFLPKDDIEGIKSSRERSWRFNMMPVEPLIYEGNRRNLFF